MEEKKQKLIVSRAGFPHAKRCTGLPYAAFGSSSMNINTFPGTPSCFSRISMQLLSAGKNVHHKQTHRLNMHKTYLSTCPHVHLSTCPHVQMSKCPNFHLSTCSHVHRSPCPHVHLSTRHTCGRHGLIQSICSNAVPFLRETLSLSPDADSITNTKMNRNGQCCNFF